jgi:signal peptidase I
MRRLASAAAMGALLLLALGWLAFLRPAALGGPAGYIVIRGDSMEPMYDSGDLVVTRAAGAYEVGDVVAYRLPPGEVGAGEIVIHRVVGLRDGRFVLQGDNNPDIDPWLADPRDVVGRAWVHLPVIGRLLAIAHDPVILGALTASVVFTWLLLGGLPGGRSAAGRRRAGEGAGAGGILIGTRSSTNARTN